MTTQGQQCSLFEIKKYAQKGLYLWPSDAAYLLAALDPPALGPMLIREEKLVVQAHGGHLELRDARPGLEAVVRLPV